MGKQKYKKWEIRDSINQIICSYLLKEITHTNKRLLEELVFRKNFRIEGRSFE